MTTPIADTPLLSLIEVAGSVQPTVQDQALVVLTDVEAFDQFYARMKNETDAHVADISTDKGRRAVIALARRVTTTKTAITAAAKSLTEGWREQTAKVNAARRPIEERLAALAEEIRRPVTEWETAEDARIAENEATVRAVNDAAIVTMNDTSASVEARGRAIHAQTIFGDRWSDEEASKFYAAQKTTVAILVAARDRLRQEEVDRAELDRLRTEAAERAAKDEADRIAREEAEQIERERVAAEQARAYAAECAAKAAQDEADRIAQAAAAAVAEAQREAEEAADRERREREAEYARQLAEAQAERDRIAKAAQDAEVERQRIANAEAEERDRIAAEDARRAKNRTHVASVMGEAKSAIMSCGVDEPTAKAIVLAIKANTIPHVGITF